MRGVLPGAILLCGAFVASNKPASAPRFAEGNQLLRPERYREWVFVGSGLGMNYSEKAYEEPPAFTNVFIKPEAYREFVATGEFPDGTVFVLEIRTAGSRASINKHGQFQDRLVGIEASVKDEKRFPERWAYFSFIGKNGEALAQAKSLPKESCWKCHNEHAAADNVFLQFYPALGETRDKAKAK